MKRFLAGQAILVVEDDYLIALDLSEVLAEWGARVVGPAGRLPEAQALARTEHLHGAILDINIGGTTSYPLARQLIADSVALVFMTGYSCANIDEEFAHVPCLLKPFDLREGETMLRRWFM